MAKPVIMFLDENKNKCYKDVKGPISLGSDKNCSCVLPNIPSVADRHIIIYEENGEYFAKNLSLIIVSINGVALNRCDRKSLGKSSSFVFGRCSEPNNFTVVTWEDKSKDILKVTGRNPKSKIINQNEKPSDIEEQESKVEHLRLNIKKEKNKSLDGQMEYLREKFYYDFQNVEANRKKVCDYVTKFIQENFSSFTVAIFRKLGGRWRGVSSKRLDKTEEYGPARQIFFKAAEEKVPMLAKIRKKRDTEGRVDIGGQEFEASMTVVNIPVTRVIYVPLLQGNECFGMLYLDSQDRDVDERDLEKISALFNDNGITGILSGYLIDDKQEMKFLREQVKPHKVRDWKFKIKNRNIHYPVVSHSHLAGIGASRIVYGHCGDNLHIATKAKAYLDSMQDMNELLKPYEYLKFIQKFVYKLSSDITPGMIDIYYTYPLPSASDLEDDYSLKMLNVEQESDDEKTRETHDIQLNWCGPVHIYVRKEGTVSKLSLETSERPLKIKDFAIGDFIIGSLFQLDMYQIQQMSGNLDFVKRFSDTFKDFCLLIREK